MHKYASLQVSFVPSQVSDVNEHENFKAQIINKLQDILEIIVQDLMHDGHE